MNNIDIQLQKIKQSKHIGLMTHVVVGYPSLEATIPLIETLASAGSDFIELQIPFSDPIADGPIIMKASDYALQKGMTVKDCFAVMEKATKKVEVPLLFMGYYNTVFRYGVEKFCNDSKASGASGLIIPDMPPDEEIHEKFIKYSRQYGLYQIRVISPASSPNRMQLNSRIADGFVYCVSHYGVTGSRKEYNQQLEEYVIRVKKFFNLPVAVGFGISKPEHLRQMLSYVDIAVVGSEIIRRIDEGGSLKTTILRVQKLVRSLQIERNI